MEALVVIAIIGIAAAIGVPSLLTQLARLNLESAATDVANLFRQTRLRAIRDNAEYTVGVDSGKVVGEGVIDSVEIEFDDPNVMLGDGAADCLDTYSAAPDYDGDSVTYSGNGVASGTGAICIHDGKGNILQVVVEFTTAQPKIRKYLPAVASPTSNEGFFEKTGFSAAGSTSNVWVWY